ncbi:MAG TPA: hypothetical protein VIK87_02760 [Sphingomonadales bacterium]
MVQRELHHSSPPGRGRHPTRPGNLAASHLARSDELEGGHGRPRGAKGRLSDAGAFYELGLRSATGASPDLVAAHKWFNLAALHGMRQAELERAELAQMMTAAEIAEAQRQAREWLARH